MRSILIIDDNEELAENLQEILDAEGHEVHIAPDAEAGLALLDTRTFDLVLTDMRMPGMCGADLAREIGLRWPEVPVIPMTAYASDEALASAHRNGAIGLISKPVRIEELCRVVARFAGEGSSVLVVEDDPDMGANLVEVLHETESVVPHWCRNAESARRIAGQRTLRAAIIDIRLPDGNGLELGRELRASTESPLPVVYITGYAGSVEAALRAMPFGDDELLLRKPFAPGDLVAAVERAVV